MHSWLLTLWILTAGAPGAPGQGSVRGCTCCRVCQGCGKTTWPQNQGETTTLPCPDHQAGPKPALAVRIHHQTHIQSSWSCFFADSKCWSFPMQLQGEGEKQERSKQPGLCARERTGLGWAAPGQAVLRLDNFRDQLPHPAPHSEPFQPAHFNTEFLCAPSRLDKGYINTTVRHQRSPQQLGGTQSSFTLPVKRCLQPVSPVLFNPQPVIHLPSRIHGAAGH